MPTPASSYGFAFNGWLFGGAGQGVQVLSIEGLEDLPTLRTSDAGRGFADGVFTGSDYLNNRTIVMELQIMSDANAPMSTYLAQLKQYLLSQTAGTGVLQFLIPNRGVQRVNARVRRRAIKIDPEYTYGKAYALVEFFCPDPRLYNDTATTASLVPTAGALRTYNRTYNRTYTVTSAGATSVVLTNNGNYQTFPTFTITGTCASPLITNYSTGQILSFPSATLGSTDVLLVDCDLKTVMLNGVAARNLLSNTSQWFGLSPNVATTINYSVSSGSGSCNISFRDAYI